MMAVEQPGLLSDGPSRLERLPVEHLEQLALDDLVVVEFGLARNAITGRVGITIGEQAVEFIDGAQNWYRLDREGVLQRVGVDGETELVGEDASVSVVREIVPDGGREVGSEAHLRTAIETADNEEVRYHARQALQLLVGERIEREGPV